VSSDVELRAYRIMAETGLSARELAEMDMDSYARLTGRQTPAQAAIAALDAQSGQAQPQAPQQPPAPLQEPQEQPQGIDLASMSMEQYGGLRGQLGVTGREYGTGIMNSAGGTDAWVEAAQRKAGRHGWQAGNVEGPAQPDSGKYLQRNEPVTGRASFYRGD
jgi:hypothetical protein